ncbi:hypothetical protein VNI00_006602 [Paramarasmius palmivorus]|uniref:Saponin hydrolase n=1 Tax=Paramarasmius palmivorus TaxID=297713 RepID=A0AAW0D521_9AGAR
MVDFNAHSNLFTMVYSISTLLKALLGVSYVVATTLSDLTPTPEREPIEITELSLPPALADTTEGACTLKVNPSGTGCIAQTYVQSGDFTPDGNHVIATATFVGASSGSIYSGSQVMLLKADNTNFSNGDAWKCVTCGVPDSNKFNVTGDIASYPQTFKDGTRAMSGAHIIACGVTQLTSDECTPNSTYIYPIFLDDGTSSGMSIRELRLHPDNVHVSFNSFTLTSSGNLGEVTGIGRLQFNAANYRYELVNVTLLINPNLPQPISVTDDGRLLINRSAIQVGELRGWTGTGKEVTYIGYPLESCNIDILAVELATGTVRRITSHPEYVDPISVSPDDQWQVVMDTRGSDRMMFMSAMRTVPPITDLITVTASSSVRNNGVRRFFQPILLDHGGDRGTYFGQQINAAGDGSPGSINDPNWNGGADPRWSLDGTKVSYYQWLALSPDCGGSNPLPCETSPYPDGRASRVMVAHLTSRSPLSVPDPADLEISDEVSWGTKYTAGMPIPEHPIVPAGKYTLFGASSGYANVTFVWSDTSSTIKSTAVAYHNFSDDGENFLTGFENVTATQINETLNHWDWYSDIKSTGSEGNGSKVTSVDGFHMEVDVLSNYFIAEGNLTTSIDGLGSWYQPCNHC